MLSYGRYGRWKSDGNPKSKLHNESNVAPQSVEDRSWDQGHSYWPISLYLNAILDNEVGSLSMMVWELLSYFAWPDSAKIKDF